MLINITAAMLINNSKHNITAKEEHNSKHNITAEKKNNSKHNIT